MEFKSKSMKSIVFLITYAIILMYILDNVSGLGVFFSKAISICSPFILGAAMAFILNSPMMFIEKLFFGERSLLRKVGDKVKRPVSYLITLIIFTATIIIISFIIIPEVVKTFQDLALKLPAYWSKWQIYIVKNLIDNPELTDWINSINIDWTGLEQGIISFFQRSALDWVNSTFSFASSLLGSFVTFILAFIFSIYILFQKETLSRQIKKIILAFLSKKTADRIFYIGSLSNQVFSNFLSGQLVEALIIGGMFLVAMTIFKFPYALIISLIISITALIPMIGAFIGCGIGIFLILVDSPTKALWFIIMFIIIQQIEGNLIYPHVVGKAAGLPSIWILVAVTLGGSLMGVLGILLFIPIGSILYALLREAVNYRLKIKGLDKEV
jgi:predicted PurR-regulated permease PerM